MYVLTNSSLKSDLPSADLWELQLDKLRNRIWPFSVVALTAPGSLFEKQSSEKGTVMKVLKTLEFNNSLTLSSAMSAFHLTKKPFFNFF